MRDYGISDYVLAPRVTMADAKKLFAQGRSVVVSTQRSRSIGVSDMTVRHNDTTTTWAALEQTCRDYGLRRHSFYVMDAA